jgi:putative GTP pyrophosphokinase
MSKELEFIQKYESEKPMLKEWGDEVTEYIISEIEKLKLSKLFIRIPPKPRLKENKELIKKAFYRNKDYSDPYNDITDKIGTRFVVLLVEDIEEIKKIIEENEHWNYSEDRDFEEERNKQPELFTYQAVHYIVRNKLEIDRNGTKILSNTPCEIQIKTILQHAYSELTHDSIYKPGNLKIPPNIHRHVARSMALIETTDKIFSNVNKKINKMENEFNNIIAEISTIGELDKSKYDKDINSLLFENYKELINKSEIKRVVEFFNNKTNLRESIIKNSSENLLFSQPIIFILYYLFSNQTHLTKSKWILSSYYSDKILTDLGIANPA